MNGYDYILAALYHIRGRFSDLRPFMQLLPFDARELPYSAHDVAVAIDQAHVQIIRRDNISESTVLELLIDEELQRVKHCILDSSIAAEIDRRLSARDGGFQQDRPQLKDTTYRMITERPIEQDAGAPFYF